MSHLGSDIIVFKTQLNILWFGHIFYGRSVPSFRFIKYPDLFGCVLLSQACDNDESVRSIWCRLERVDTFFMLEKKEMTCCFTGHRILPRGKEKQIFEKTKEVVIELIAKGVKFFGTGGAIGYDTIAAQVVLSLKEKYPFIKLIVVCPCKNQDARWNESQKRIYKDILNNADKIVVLADTYYDGCMQVRNRHLVDNSKYCVCYLTRNCGGTYSTVNYAKEQKSKLIRIY